MEGKDEEGEADAVVHDGKAAKKKDVACRQAGKECLMKN